MCRWQQWPHEWPSIFTTRLGAFQLTQEHIGMGCTIARHGCEPSSRCRSCYDAAAITAAGDQPDVGERLASCDRLVVRVPRDCAARRRRAGAGRLRRRVSGVVTAEGHHQQGKPKKTKGRSQKTTGMTPKKPPKVQHFRYRNERAAACRWRG